MPTSWWRRLPRGDGITYVGLVLNRKGFERAAAAGISEINMVVVASDTFNRRNQGVGTVERSRLARHRRDGARHGIRGQVTSSARPSAVRSRARCRSSASSIVEAVADAWPSRDRPRRHDRRRPGRATSTSASARCAPVSRHSLRCHFHNTRNTGYANAWAAIGAGAATLDASFGGVGGCPFAPRATGNIATEDLLYMLDRSGVSTGLDLGRAIAAADWLEAAIEKTLPGQLMKAGVFPPVH